LNKDMNMRTDPGFGWHMPVNVQFGAGALERLPDDLGDGQAVLLTFDGAEALGLTGRLQRSLGERLRYVETCPDGLSDLVRARALCRRIWPILAQRPDTVLIALGGGTVMDLAKVVRCRPVGSGFDDLQDALRGESPWPALALTRLWLVPTTAGTGSEVTRWATVWDTDGAVAMKRSLDEPFGYAERAYVDPLLTLSCPWSVTCDTALDALAHALESIWNRHANPVSTALALNAARRVIAALPLVRRDRMDLAARSELSLAALEAGLAFSQTRTALAHALSYALTLEQGVPHGRACALWLPTVWRLAAGRDVAADRALGQVFGGSAVMGADRLARWLQTVGVEPGLESIGLLDGEERVAAALSSARGRNFLGATA
jgi:phosphonate metabolism-associated iron-containing alcohol dehydrogenase